MNCFLSRLSLIEENNEEREEVEIEDYRSDSDSESAYTLVRIKSLHMLIVTF